MPLAIQTDMESPGTTAPPGHLLLIEEDPGLERILSLLLKRAGYRVSVGRSFTYTEGKDGPFAALIADLSSTTETQEALLANLGRVAPELPTVLIVPYGQELPVTQLPARYSLLNSPLAGEELLHCLDRLFGNPAEAAADMRPKP